jgi:hypothetical protein
MTELRQFKEMLDRIGAGYGLRSDYNPPGESVQVEHPDEDNETGFWVTEWTFDQSGSLTSMGHYRGEPG